MAEQGTNSNDFLGLLLAKREACEAELRAINAAISAFKLALGASGESMPPPAAPTPTPPVQSAPIAETPQPFYGQGQVDAAISVLERHGEPLTIAEIIEKMRQEGFNFASNKPSTSMFWALRKRANDKGDILNLPGGKVGLLAWRVDDKEFMQMHAGLRAARARGVLGGARTKMTAEQVARFDAMRAEGKGLRLIAKDLGMSLSGLQKWATKRRLENEENQ